MQLAQSVSDVAFVNPVMKFEIKNENINATDEVKNCQTALPRRLTGDIGSPDEARPQ
eukprot:Awhi_evm1s5874